ncbi:peptidase M42 [Fulvitalea axinellae]|uniref:Peptidase M42 n=1 Tax=Fulvitalea axinellae TaxID=1182444 RepID=A0AAU9CM89_9BACT|nr:peptidase M42 [Fulvitalea axinellae]
MDKKSKTFLYEYLNNNAPTGFETGGQRLWIDYVSEYADEYFTDTYGTAVAVVNPEAEFKVVIEAHADEIAWYVNYISEKGYLYVIRNGGSDFQIAPSMRAKVHTETGEVLPAVFGWPALHVREKGKEPKPTQENLTLDCGCTSREEVEALGIHVGAVVTFDQDLAELNEKFLVGRALDNRIGGFMIAEVLRHLREEKVHLPFGLYVTNAVQEEVGLRGASMIAHRLKPNLAIVTDVCHDTQSPLYNKIKQGDISAGKGPVLTVAPAVHNKLLTILRETATKHEIPFQRAASSRFTGTDTDAFAYSGEGVASALVSLPLKYMHTTVEMVALSDVENLVKLFFEFLKTLEPDIDLKYIG